MNEFCRVCLLRRPQLVSLLADSRSCGTPILDMLASVCGIHFKESPRLSHVICERCLAKLELAYAVALEFRDQEMLRRTLWQTDAWLVRLEQYQTMAREEPRSERLLRELIASESQERETETIIGDKEEITAEIVVKEEQIIEDGLNKLCEDEMEPCSAPVTAEYAVPIEKPCSSLGHVEDTVLEEQRLQNKNPNESQENQPDEEVPVSKRYWCKECRKTFISLSVFRNHLRKHQQQKRTCAHCQRTFRDVKSFQCHVSWHNRKGLLCCSTCGENLVTTESLKNHICPMASKPVQSKKTFSTKKYNQIHENIRKGTFKCEICLKSFGGKVSLRNHMRKHQVFPKYVKPCEECGKQLTSANAYNCHIYRHRKDQSGSYHCSKCEKNFSTSARLVNHKCSALEQSQDGEITACSETALKEEPIIEDDIPSSAQTYSEVLVKEEISFEENSLATIKEEPTVENDSELESPSAESPATTESEWFECKECGKRFSRENYYRNHLQKHENIRAGTFQCKVCQQCLGGQRELRDHKRNNHKPMPKWMQNCAECGRGFATANAYRCHMKRHKIVRSGWYRCEACGKCMTHRQQLTQHKCPAGGENK